MSPLTSLLATDRQPIPPKLLPNVLAGLTVGLVSLTYSVSFAALIFTGSLSPGFPQGVDSALITSAIVGFNLLWQVCGLFVPLNPHEWDRQDRCLFVWGNGGSFELESNAPPQCWCRQSDRWFDCGGI